MAKITVDGKTVECQPHHMILQACLEAGVELPHYCYHAGLSIPANCRICLVEVEGIPKLVPSCQTQVRDGMVVYSKSTKAIANQKQVMEFLLINHPLDCPVCDQAGECFLQDYSYQYGRSQSRFEEDKAKKPKKDVGEHIYLYSDRCIMCTRCVRFTREVAGTSELYVDGRGHKEQIDIFPGRPCNNKLSGNVVDICPVGALLDKEFLFKQRVWLLQSTPSISPVDSGGENTLLDHNEGIVYRIRPRFNAEVNKWWISDDTRYCYKVLYDDSRLRKAMRREHGGLIAAPYRAALDAAAAGLKTAAQSGGLFAMLSPQMSCEEAWLLGQYIRSIDKNALLVLGPVPTTGHNEVFKHSVTGKQTFEIQAEKVPNAAGIRRVLGMLGGPTATFDGLGGRTFGGGWIVGGYLSAWTPAKLPPALTQGFRVVQDLLKSDLATSADVVLPVAAWAEKDGCWENFAGKIQPFEAAVAPPDGVMREADAYLSLLGRTGMFNATAVRNEMGEPFASVKISLEHHAEPAMEFAEL
ncbi:MAG TPA: 2Fe-2S iron-sulfur cluster-binding protein [Tepidisphaeraceae bacterium]|nr:2Fe-2S iron-sulfur cluster-binding protein [Tepidisphaeraceae bacterium]